MKRRPTIRDLAKLAGVSRTTVSLALRGSHSVSEPLREKINRLAEEQGYQSHPMVSALMQQVAAGRRVHDREGIGVVTFVASADAWHVNHWVASLIDGVREAAERLGFRVEVHSAGERGERAGQVARVLYHRGVKGLLFTPMSHDCEPLDLPWERFVPVSCTLSAHVPRLPCVTSNLARGIHRLLAAARERGVRSAGLVVLRTSDRRLDGVVSSAFWSAGQSDPGFKTSILYLDALDEERRFVRWIYHGSGLCR